MLDKHKRMIKAGRINVEIMDFMELDKPEYKEYMITRAKHSLGMDLANKAIDSIHKTRNEGLKSTRYNMGALLMDAEIAYELFNNIKEISGKKLSPYASYLIDYILSELKGGN